MPLSGNPVLCQSYRSLSGSEALQSIDIEHSHITFTMEQLLLLLLGITGSRISKLRMAAV